MQEENKFGEPEVEELNDLQNLEELRQLQEQLELAPIALPEPEVDGPVELLERGL